MSVKAGQTIKLGAKFSGSPPPTVTWSKNGVELAANDRVKIRGNGADTELISLDAEREDTGVYTVTCVNAFGTKTVDVNVTVLGKKQA